MNGVLRCGSKVYMIPIVGMVQYCSETCAIGAQTGLLIQIRLAGVGIQYVGEVKPAGVPSALRLVGLRRDVPVPGLKRKYERKLEMTRPTCSKSIPSRQRHHQRYE